MNRQQKIAWFNLVVVSLALGLSVAIFGVGYFVFGVSARQAAAGFGFIGIAGLIGLTPFLFKKNQGKVQYDERDAAIQRKSVSIAYAIFWVLFVAAAMVPWFIMRPDRMITVEFLPWMAFVGFCTVTLLQSIVTLKEYGWKGKGNE